VVAAACVAGALLIGGAAGRIFFKDGGELSAAALSMGVPHPTGFAVWTGLARVCSLLPLGPLPVRIALAIKVLSFNHLKRCNPDHISFHIQYRAST